MNRIQIGAYRAGVLLIAVCVVSALVSAIVAVLG